MKKKTCTVLLFLVLFFNTLPVGAAEKDGRKWQDETVYYLMVDRFNNSDQTNDKGVDINDPNGCHGGDFQGIINQLDYIKEWDLLLFPCPLFLQMKMVDITDIG